MTARKQKKHTRKAGLVMRVSGVSSDGHETARSMNYWLERINPSDIERLWTQLRGVAKDALPRTTWVEWVNGTIERVGLRLDVTACTTHGGFVLTFTVSDTFKSAGETEKRGTHAQET